MMSYMSALAGLMLLSAQAAGQTETVDQDRPLRPVSTYSIVARDAATGELGVAVQSHWFSVGSVVSWAAPGVGAVATQSFTLPDYGPNGLALMRHGLTADLALAATIAADDLPEVRQVAMVDARGNTAVHTGDSAIVEACDHEGEGFTVQANLMRNATVCAAMIEAYLASDGDLAERMMAALEAAEGEGGDIRGRQSAALLVVSGDASEPAWGGRVFDLRVEDHQTPLAELRRLLEVARVYRHMGEGDEHFAAGDIEAATASYSAAAGLAPDNHEVVFWHAVTLTGAGELDAALPLYAQAFEAWPLWRELVPRLPAAGLLPDDDDTIEAIVSAGR